MGLGKTVQTLTATIYRMQEGDKVVIFCPNKALYVWQDEIQKWFGLDSLIYAGTPRQREKLRDQIPDYHFTITTYGMAAELLNIKWEGFIADEIHEAGLLNHKTKTYASFEKLCKNVWWFYLLTGTPIRQGVIDLYAPLHLVAPEVFKNYWQFVNAHCITIPTAFGKSIERNPRNIAEFRKILDNYMVRRLKSEVLKDLPGKQRQSIPLKMSKVQEKAHKEILEEFIYLDDDALVVTPNAMTAMLKARQLLVTPRLLGIDDDGAALEYIAEEGKNLLESNRPFVVFTPFRAAIPIVEDVILSNYPDTTVYKLMGGLKPNEFANQWQGFMNDPKSKKVLLCTIKSGASFHATCAADVFFLGYEWDFNYNTQAEDRCCRLGQTNFVHCNYLLHKDTVDENVRLRLNSKQDASNWIVGTEEQYKMMLQRVRHSI
jgi:SNF2 family DNA or RNA helicase